MRDYRLGIVSLFLAAAALSVAPFAVYRLSSGQWLVALADAAIVAGMVAALVYVWKTGKVRLTGIIAAGFANAMAVIAIVGLGLAHDWLYTALIATFLVTPRPFAIVCSSIVILAVAGWPGTGDTLVERLTFVAVASMISLFSLIFASGVNRQQERLSRQAQIDPLTGVGNRRALEIELADRGRADGRNSLGVALLDIDHFKRVNDDHGHAAGDRVLVDLAKLLRRTVRRSDRIFRLGGEEFVVLFDGAGEGSLRAVTDKLMERIRSELEGPDGPITVSMGATVLHAGENTQDALDRADRAMYQAKEKRDRAVLA